MKVKELIEALQKQDPNSPARLAIKAIHAEAAAAEQARLLTPEGLRACHVRMSLHAKSHRDSKGNGNDNPAAVAFHSTRSELFAALQAKSPPPGPDPADEGDPDLLHANQKRHNIKLWKQVDALVSAAGLTEKGAN